MISNVICMILIYTLISLVIYGQLKLFEWICGDIKNRKEEKIMAKNNFFVEQMKAVYREANKVTPKIYASMATVLFEQYGWTADQINEFDQLVIENWERCNENNVDVLQHCTDVTGIVYCYENEEFNLSKWNEFKNKNSSKE